MTCCQTEPTLDQLLADPLTLAVMDADHVNRDDVATMLHAVADGFAPDQPSRAGSMIGGLVGMLATYYDAALCGRTQPGNQIRMRKAS